MAWSIDFRPATSSRRQIPLSIFGRLRAAGFAVIATFDPPHYTVALSDGSELTIARLSRCFDDPIPNPGFGLPIHSLDKSVRR